MLVFGACTAAATARFARQPVKRGIEPARVELFAGFDLFAAFPPVRVLRLAEDVLRTRLRRFLVDIRVLFLAFARYGFSFFLTSLGSTG